MKDRQMKTILAGQGLSADSLLIFYCMIFPKVDMRLYLDANVWDVPIKSLVTARASNSKFSLTNLHWTNKGREG